MSCPSCLVALSGPDQYTVRRSGDGLGDQPPSSPSLGSLGVFVLSAAGVFLALSFALPAAARRASR